MFLYLFLNQRNMFVRFSRQGFHIIPGGFYLPGGKFTPRSHPRKFSKIENTSFKTLISKKAATWRLYKTSW